MIHSEEIASQVWNQLLEAHDQSLSERDYHKLIGLAPVETAATIVRIKALPVNPLELMRAYWKVRTTKVIEEVEIQQGLFELLDELDRLNLTCGIASNSSTDYVERVAEGLGFKDHFEVLLGSDAVARAKPHPDVYLAAAELLGAAPGTCLVLEDSVIGLRAAVSAQMRCVVIPHANLRGQDFSAAFASYDSFGAVISDLELILG